MKNKENYFDALIENNGRMNEIDLGESIGLTEDETNSIIVQLLSEYKIEFRSSRACNYSVKMRKRSK